MALVTLKEMLGHAHRNGYAVPMFNVVSIEFLDAILRAAVDARSPLILGVAEVHLEYVSLELLAPAIHQAAQVAPIPVVVHFDHGKALETVIRAIRAGFTSVMLDASDHPFEENVRITREVVRVARAVGASVEGEIGRMVGAEASLVPKEAREELFTNPEEAAEFVRQTKVDALAVSVGTVHGRYMGEPRLDFERLHRIAELVPLPLVLHGGSGTPSDQLKRAVELGVAKVNFFTDLQMATVEAMGRKIAERGEMASYGDVAQAAKGAIYQVAREKIGILGSEGVCSKATDLCASCKGCELRERGWEERIAEIAAKAALEALRRMGPKPSRSP